MGRAACSTADPRAVYAQASMRRALRRLSFETHPLRALQVCTIECDGDVLMLDEHEVQRAADSALSRVLGSDIRRFSHLPDVRLDFLCRERLAHAANTLTLEGCAS